MSWLYVAISCSICSSVSMRSTRAISCTWNRIVSVFSNTIVMSSPSATRRRFFISMIVAAEALALALVRRADP